MEEILMHARKLYISDKVMFLRSKLNKIFLSKENMAYKVKKIKNYAYFWKI